jgi:hypothetical protein
VAGKIFEEKRFYIMPEYSAKQSIQLNILNFFLSCRLLLKTSAPIFAEVLQFWQVFFLKFLQNKILLLLAKIDSGTAIKTLPLLEEKCR